MANERVRNRLNDLLEEHHQSELKRQAKKILADPKANRACGIWERDKAKTFYFRGPTLRDGGTLIFCWSKYPNLAGFYVSWVRTDYPDHCTEARQAVGHRTRREAKAFALELCERNGGATR